MEHCNLGSIIFLVTTSTNSAQPTGSPKLGTGLLISLATLSAVGPFGIDMYVPSFVEIAEEFGTSQSRIQLTLTAFLAGMALGQLFIGALSDSLGRKRPLVTATVFFLITSVLCAISPSISLLIALRLIQGLAGGAVVVLSRSVVPDLARGKASASAFSILMAISSLAPAIAPLIGGMLAPAFGWRSVFWLLAALAAVMVALTVFVVPESLPEDKRSARALRDIFPKIAKLVRRPAYMGYLLAFAGGFSVMFSYISASPFIFQQQLGLSTQMYSVVFATNAAMLTVMSLLNSRLVKSYSERSIIFFALTTMLVLSILLFIDAILGPNLWVTWALLFVTVPMMSLIFGNATALAMETIRDIGIGAGSGFMGFSQFLAAAIAAPLVGLGANAALSMSISMIVCAIIALTALFTLAKSRA